MKRRDAGLLLANMALIATGLARADGYPEKPLRMVVPYPPGASTDALGRIVAQKMAASTGQPVLVDNRSGASGNIGSELVAKAAGDPYTFLLGTDATHSSNMHMVANPPFNPIRDFTPLTLACMNPIVLVVHPSVPANTISELVAYVKANPNRGGYGSSGTGSPHHLAGELLKARTGAPFVHVPYRGGGPALNDVIGGQVPLFFANVASSLGHIESGRLRPLAVTTRVRARALPQVPTMEEAGVPAYEVLEWNPVLAPAATPAAVQERLRAALRTAIADPEVLARIRALSGEPFTDNDPAKVAAFLQRQREQWGKLVRERHITAG